MAITKEEIIARAKARAVEVAEKLEEIKLTNEMKYIESDRYLTDEVFKADQRVINSITTPLAAISDKQFSLYQEFNFDEQANLIIGAIKSILLQKKAGFEALNDAVALDSANNGILASFIDVVKVQASNFPSVLGRNTYFNKLTGQVQAGELGDAGEMVAMLEAVCRDMGLASVNFSAITQTKLELIEERAIKKANIQAEDNELLNPDNNVESSDAEYKVV